MVIGYLDTKTSFLNDTAHSFAKASLHAPIIRALPRAAHQAAARFRTLSHERIVRTSILMVSSDYKHISFPRRGELYSTRIEVAVSSTVTFFSIFTGQVRYLRQSALSLMGKKIIHHFSFSIASPL